MATLTFVVTTDRTYSKTVEDGTEQNELDRFVKGHMPYSHQWIEVDNGDWIRRDAILSVRIAEAPGVAFG